MTCKRRPSTTATRASRSPLASGCVLGNTSNGFAITAITSSSVMPLSVIRCRACASNLNHIYVLRPPSPYRNLLPRKLVGGYDKIGEQQRCDLSSGFLLKVRDRMAVHVESERDRGVAQSLGHDLRMYTCLQRESRVGMA